MKIICTGKSGHVTTVECVVDVFVMHDDENGNLELTDSCMNEIDLIRKFVNIREEYKQPKAEL